MAEQEQIITRIASTREQHEDDVMVGQLLNLSTSQLGRLALNYYKKKILVEMEIVPFLNDEPGDAATIEELFNNVSRSLGNDSGVINLNEHRIKKKT